MLKGEAKKIVNSLLPKIIEKLTNKTIARYNRIAPVYDFLERGSDPFVNQLRSEIWGQVTGMEVLEIGCGTGKNIPFYPKGKEITAIDFSEKMIQQAIRKSLHFYKPVKFKLADIQALPFDNETFDTVIGTFVFCSVPDPLSGLKEIRRVLRPGGQLFLLEHVLSRNKFRAVWQNLINPLMFFISGDHTNRQTLKSIEVSGFEHIEVKNLLHDFVIQIKAINL